MKLIKIGLVKKESKGGAHFIENLIKNALRSTGRGELTASIVVDSQAGALYVPEGISRTEIDRILAHTKVPCRIEEVEGDKLQLAQEHQAVYPADYGYLKG